MMFPGVTIRPSYSRLISNTGATNIEYISVANRGAKFFTDICTTLIDIQWRWNLLLFFGCFVITWVLFAVFYILLAGVHGDDIYQDDWLPCVENVQTYTQAFLFSIETMTTIGYGYRYVTEACPGAYVGVIAQSILGAAMQFALAGLVVAKVKRAKKRSWTLLFSRQACIYAEDLKLRLVIRIGDMRKSDIIGAHAKAYFIRKTYSRTGDKIPVQYFYMKFRSEGGDERLFLPWPSYIVHDIDEDSPLYNLSRDDTMNANFEMILVLEGVASTLSKAFQVRKSYHPWEIKWGHRFVPLGLSYEDVFDANIVDYENFHETKPVTTPMVSAMEIDDLDSRDSLTHENLQRRRDSRLDWDLFPRHKTSITDTFLGAESDLSASNISISSSETSSLQDVTRKISTYTYHGPGTLEQRRNAREMFLSPALYLHRKRRHSTGEFLDPESTRRRRQSSHGVLDLRKHGSQVFRMKTVIEKRQEDDSNSAVNQLSEDELRYDYMKVSRNITSRKGSVGKASDSGTSAPQRIRRQSAWQFPEQAAFIESHRRLTDRYLGPHLEVVESEGSDNEDQTVGLDKIQDEEHNTRALKISEDETSKQDVKDQEVSERSPDVYHTTETCPDIQPSNKTTVPLTKYKVERVTDTDTVSCDTDGSDKSSSGKHHGYVGIVTGSADADSNAMSDLAADENSHDADVGSDDSNDHEKSGLEADENSHDADVGNDDNNDHEKSGLEADENSHDADVGSDDSNDHEKSGLEADENSHDADVGCDDSKDHEKSGLEAESGSDVRQDIKYSRLSEDAAVTDCKTIDSPGHPTEVADDSENRATADLAADATGSGTGVIEQETIPTSTGVDREHINLGYCFDSEDDIGCSGTKIEDKKYCSDSSQGSEQINYAYKSDSDE